MAAPTPIGTPLSANSNGGEGSNVEGVIEPLSRKRLQEIVKVVDPNEQLDEDVEEILLQFADEYMEGLMEGACTLAAHRKGTKVEAEDVQAFLEQKHRCSRMPGFGSDDPPKAFKMGRVTEAHKQRIALIKKVIKKH